MTEDDTPKLRSWKDIRAQRINTPEAEAEVARYREELERADREEALKHRR